MNLNLTGLRVFQDIYKRSNSNILQSNYSMSQLFFLYQKCTVVMYFTKI